jgi:RHS repeat-associated protein
MKHIYNIISLLILPLCLLAQSPSQNYILTRTYQTADGSISLDKIQYFDGLGRPVETVQKNQSSKDGNIWVDLVNRTEYDGFGREYKHWLPVPSSGNTGAYVAPADFTLLANSEYSNGEKPYTTTDFEATPLNRVTGKYGAGASWYTAKKNDSILYQTNASEVVYFFVTSDNQLHRTGNYSANTLYKTQTMDEDGKVSFEYKDMQGQVVMKQSSTDAVNTYYVYNDLEQLSYVLPPIASAALITSGATIFTDPNSLATLNKYGYKYIYDERGNNVVKSLPGCDSICMVYDKANRLVMSQDGNQRVKNKWTVTKYDVFGRVIYTGLLNSSSTRVQFKAILDNQVITETYNIANTFYNIGYTCTGSLTGIIPLTVNYYDNYAFTSLAVNGSSLNWGTPPAGYGTQFASATGLLTGTRTYILDKTISSYITSAMYYDDRGRVVQTRATNYLNGNDTIYNRYDFTGKLLNVTKGHSIAGNGAVHEVYRYEYDKAGRLTKTMYKLNTKDSVLLSRQTYDELGRLQYNYRHNNTDTIAYTYNIRNWISTIKSGAFAEELFYNTFTTTKATPCYNGNIAYSTWKYNLTKKAYIYTYNQLNRLINADAYTLFSTIFFALGYNESFTYDMQGNINILQRKTGTTNMDYLVFGYNGNQVNSIFDYYGSQNLYSTKEYNNLNTTSNEFLFDANGNMTTDLDRKIATIRYNILNLPDTIQFNAGNQIINRYAADGRKLQTDYYTKTLQLTVPLAPGTVNASTDMVAQSTTIYVDNKEYQTVRTPVLYNKLNMVYNSEGYVTNFGAYPPAENYCYYRKDHLGNNREVWRAAYIGGTTGNLIPAATVQQTQYYPSGLPWTSNSTDNPGLQERKYNGKEFIEMNGYDTYDYGARGYYPAMGRFTSVDPLAEKYYSISPYAYCKGNPVKFIDPNGMDWFVSDFGKLYYNNTYGKNDISKIEGNGWSWLGPNDMFMQNKDDFDNSDQILVAKENGGKIEINQNNPLSTDDDELIMTLDIENTKDAEDFMNDRGYEKKPTKLIADEIETFSISQYLPLPMGGKVNTKDLLRTEIWLSMTYAPINSQISKNTKLLTWDPMVNGNHVVMLEKLKYQAEGTIPMLLRKTGKIYDKVTTPQYNHTNTYYNWKSYPKNGSLNEYINKYK